MASQGYLSQAIEGTISTKETLEGKIFLQILKDLKLNFFKDVG